MKMNPKTVFITGANRGLGLEMVKQFTKKYKAEEIFATYRDLNGAKELLQLASENEIIHPIKMDVQKFSTFSEIVQKVDKVVGERGLNLLINNAGVFRRESQTLEQISKEMIQEFFDVNMFGALFVTQAFLPLLKKGSHFYTEGPMTEWAKAGVVNFSSRLGSIEDNTIGGYYASRCTRSALNSATKSMSIDLKDRGIFAITVNPGWVQTDQGGINAPIMPDESITGILSVLENLTPEKNGACLQYDGKIIPW